MDDPARRGYLAARPPPSMRIFFDARELYFLTQFVPVQRVLRERGVETRFVAYHNRGALHERIRRGFEREELPTEWVESKEDGLALYQRERPDWVVFGRGSGLAQHLPEGTRTAQLYHGIGMKTDLWEPQLNGFDVRFIEGDYYAGRVRELFPDAPLVQVGYPKIDPLLWTDRERPTADLARIGLDPEKPTVLYAPTHSPSSFPNMADDWPAHFPDYNLIVKPHQLSHHSSKRSSHRRKMALWSEAPNVHVVPIESYDAVPYMNAADLMISDVSAVLYEFAATGKPVIQADFLAYHWTKSGPLWYRRWQRVDRPILRRFHGLAAHAKRYRDLARLVPACLDAPAAGSEERLALTRELVGPLDGRSAERVADVLAARGVAASPRVSLSGCR